MNTNNNFVIIYKILHVNKSKTLIKMDLIIEKLLFIRKKIQ